MEKHSYNVHLIVLIEVEVNLVGEFDLSKQKKNMDLLLKGFCETNFSKRQAKIIGFIAFLARQNKDEVAYIPKYSHFKNCGVGPNHIKRELKKLADMNVIIWNKEKMLFQINYSEEFWEKTSGHEIDRELCDYLTELNTY